MILEAKNVNSFCKEINQFHARSIVQIGKTCQKFSFQFTN